MMPLSVSPIKNKVNLTPEFNSGAVCFSGIKFLSIILILKFILKVINMSIIKNSWDKTTPICADCNKVMECVPFKKSFVYRCSHCNKQFDIIQFEKILDKIADLDAARLSTNELYSIQGEKFKISNKLKCEIVEEGEMCNSWKVAVKVLF